MYSVLHLALRLVLWALFHLTLASPTVEDVHSKPGRSQPRPLVLWHGMGDSYASAGMLEFVSMIKDVHPGIFVHSIYIEEDLSADQRAGFYGNVNEQIAQVAEQLACIEELKNGFDAIGLSQAGQFLRGYVEMYNTPPVHNLITFGSQHMGVSDVPPCRPGDFLCQIARRAVKGGVYSKWAQDNLVQAQYFRDPAEMDTYLESNHFLTSINNEIADTRNKTHAHNLASLETLVLVLFNQDKTVVPKESAWFGSEAVEDEDNIQRFWNGYEYPEQSGQIQFLDTRRVSSKTIIPMRLQPLYTEDWIGLRQLDERGAVVLETCKGEHMQLGDCWERLVKQFAGGVSN